ncbi:MAG TPA: Gfo/Idh/MocA family oxidoreductase [Gaiellales bacterium]
MRIVLCGAGHIGAVHAQNLAAHRRVDELVVADLDLARAGELAAGVGARPATPDEAFMLGPDAVVIAAATPAHAGLVRRAIAAGIPCFCEKPLSGDVDESVALVREVEAAGGVVQVGFMRRFDAGIRALRGMVERGELGRVHTLHVASHDHEPPPEAYVAVSGGMFRDQIIHDFDMVRWVTGSEVASVYATGAVRTIDYAERYGDVDTCALVLTMAGGELALLAGTREDGRGEDVRIEAVGSKDSAAAGLNARTPLRLLDPIGVEAGHPPYDGFIERFAPAYAAEIEHFLGVAAGEAANPCDPRDALSTFLVAVAAERSRAAGAPVSVQHAGDLL